MPKTIDIDLFDKQADCFAYLEDNVTTEILFGGGAGGSKTFTGCFVADSTEDLNIQRPEV